MGVTIRDLPAGKERELDSACRCFVLTKIVEHEMRTVQILHDGGDSVAWTLSPDFTPRRAPITTLGECRAGWVVAGPFGSPSSHEWTLAEVVEVRRG